VCALSLGVTAETFSQGVGSSADSNETVVAIDPGQRGYRRDTDIHQPSVDLGCKRSLEHLDELAAKARACNARLMDAVMAGQGSGMLANPVIERIAHPTTDAAGRRVPAMRFADPRVQALAGCLAVWDHAVSGITNKSLRAWMARLRGVPYAMNQVSYDLARLRGNGLIERTARTNTYRLTADGLTFALVYTRVHEQVLYPLTAHDQPIAAPAPVCAAWRTITGHIDSTVAARLGARGLNPCPRSGALSPDSGQPSKSSRPRALDDLPTPPSSATAKYVEPPSAGEQRGG
jgi:hypothetical protein